MAFTRLIRCPGVQAIHYSAAPSDRPSFHLHSFVDLDGCTITQSSASSRPLELLVRWSEDRLGAVSQSNTMYHLSVTYSRLL